MHRNYSRLWWRRILRALTQVARAARKRRRLRGLWYALVVALVAVLIGVAIGLAVVAADINPGEVTGVDW